MRKTLFNVKYDSISMDETLHRISNIIKTKEFTQHVVINVAKLVYAQKNQELRNIINSCGLINVDGAGVVMGAKLLGISIPERVAGIDLMENLIADAEDKNYRIFFFGAKEEVIQKVVHIYKEKYPNLQIAGYRNGYYTEDQEEQIAKEIRDSRADILFVAMGSPKKEFFLGKYGKLMEVPFVMGVGGSFDVVAGKVSRAPLWMQEHGLEWFYRLLQEPKRMWKRYFVTNTLFLLMILQGLVNRKYACPQG